MVNNSQGEQHRCKAEGVKYEQAMKQALSEIFQNLKEIQQDTKKRREKLNVQRRRGSAPATALRETAATFRQQPKKLDRSLSTTIPAASSTLTTMRWVLQCFEEEEEEKTLFGERLNQVLVS